MTLAALHTTAPAVANGSKPRSRKRVWMRRAGIALTVLLALIVALWITAYVLVMRGTLIDPARFARPDDSLSIVDRTGHTLRHVRVDGMDRRWVPLREISPNVVMAFLAAEDGDFYAHDGVDGRAVFRSLARNLWPWSRRSGASTLTQQLVKRVYGRRGIIDKPVEILRALTLERVFTKDEILEQYLNRVPFGDNIEGVARACEEYFGHSVANVSISEAAMLAGIPQAPSVTEPRRHLERALMRRRFVLSRLRERNALSETEYQQLRDEVPALRDAPARPYEAARFVERVLDAQHNGEINQHAGTIATSLDLQLQSEVENVLRGGIERFAERGATNGAAIVIAPSTGEILAYVGAGRSLPTDPGGALDLLMAPRQPGSTLKPFVYELLFEQGAHPATVLDDIRVSTMRGANGSLFEAQDYDGRERGPVRARVALPASLNLAALDAARRVGADKLVERLSALGIRGLHEAAQYGAAIVLGGADIRPFDLARAYTALARGGTQIPLSFVPVERPRPGLSVMKPDAVAMTWDVLSDREARANAFGKDLTLEAQTPSFALKTGTSSMWNDAWCAIATHDIVVLVWLGDPSGRPMQNVSGFEAAAPLAARMLPFALRAIQRASIPTLRVLDPRAAFRDVELCAFTGLKAGPRCPHHIHERIPADHIPRETCNAHDDEGHGVLSEHYADWMQRTHPAGVVLRNISLHASTSPPRIVRPNDDTTFLVTQSRKSLRLPVIATVDGVPSRATQWEVDGQIQSAPDGTIEFALGTHTITALWNGQRSATTHITVRSDR